MGHLIPKDTSTSFLPGDPDNVHHKIPKHELTRPDPILFYAEVPLYEDELHDNGASHFSVRIVCSSFLSMLHFDDDDYVLKRVMPGSFFILARFTLRVDNVLFRTFDTRIFHSFKNSTHPLIIRESSGWEAPYDAIRNVLIYYRFHWLYSKFISVSVYRPKMI